MSGHSQYRSSRSWPEASGCGREQLGSFPTNMSDCGHLNGKDVGPESGRDRSGEQTGDLGACRKPSGASYVAAQMGGPCALNALRGVSPSGWSTMRGNLSTRVTANTALCC